MAAAKVLGTILDVSLYITSLSPVFCWWCSRIGYVVSLSPPLPGIAGRGTTAWSSLSIVFGAWAARRAPLPVCWDGWGTGGRYAAGATRAAASALDGRDISLPCEAPGEPLVESPGCAIVLDSRH